jgi:hypothetical protein
MEGKIFNVLVVDKSLNTTALIAMLEKYKRKGYNVFVFPFTETKRETEILFFNFITASIFEQLFVVEIPHNKDGQLFCFDLIEIGAEEFCGILGKECKVATRNLTEVGG